MTEKKSKKMEILEPRELAEIYAKLGELNTDSLDYFFGEFDVMEINSLDDLNKEISFLPTTL